MISEGACIYILVTLDRARSRGAQIYGESVVSARNSDAADFVLPLAKRQAECME